MHTHQSKKLNKFTVWSLMCIDVFMSAVSLALSHALMIASMPESCLHRPNGALRIKLAYTMYRRMWQEERMERCQC